MTTASVVVDLSRNADEIVEWFSLAAFGKTGEVFLKPRMKGAGRLELLGERGLFSFRVLYSPHTRQDDIGDSRLFLETA